VLAKEHFQKISNSVKSEAGAEARYEVAMIYFRQGLYKETEKIIFELINQIPSYDYWVAKGFILLSDNYLALGDVFQAKHTLRSIIGNYEGGGEILRIAQVKLDAILEKEQSDEKKKAEEMMKKQTEYDQILEDEMEGTPQGGIITPGKSGNSNDSETPETQENNENNENNE
ncbi:MAG: hypothetical protein KKA07_13335, partial [Bacteroidetes bacterium]|nr:hypothetical protein [Bacteroidota bacterium]MBU1720042.1 hypothetical protein [Bacteroidota bacterium]